MTVIIDANGFWPAAPHTSTTYAPTIILIMVNAGRAMDLRSRATLLTPHRTRYAAGTAPAKKRPGAAPAATLRPTGLPIRSPNATLRRRHGTCGRKGQVPRRRLRSDLRSPYLLPTRTHGTAFGPDEHGVPNVRSSPRVHAPGAGRPPPATPDGASGSTVGQYGTPAEYGGLATSGPVAPVLSPRRSPRPPGAPSATSPLPRVAGRPFRTPLLTSFEHPTGAPCSMAGSWQQPKSHEPSIQRGKPSHALRATASGLPIRSPNATLRRRHGTCGRKGQVPRRRLRSDLPDSLFAHHGQELRPIIPSKTRQVFTRCLGSAVRHPPGPAASTRPYGHKGGPDSSLPLRPQSPRQNLRKPNRNAAPTAKWRRRQTQRRRHCCGRRGRPHTRYAQRPPDNLLTEMNKS